MNYFDLHCDTAYDLYHKKLSLDGNGLSVNLSGYDVFEKKAQIFAIWTDHKIPKARAYEDFFAIFDYLNNQISKNADKAVLCTESDVLLSDDTRLKIIPTVEGADLLEKGKIIEHGSHEELMALDGKYAYMFKLQADKYN